MTRTLTHNRIALPRDAARPPLTRRASSPSPQHKTTVAGARRRLCADPQVREGCGPAARMPRSLRSHAPLGEACL